MKQAEKVTFGGSGVDRCAELRENSVALADLQNHSDAQYIALWRGKLAVFENGSTLCRLTADQPVVEQARKSNPGSVIFLAMLDGTVPCFAVDISAWNPEGQDTTGMNTFLDPSEQVHPQLPPGHVFAELRRIMTRLSTQDAELAATAKAIFGWHSSHRFCSCCGAKSEMINGGWQRRCPDCAAPHFPRTDPVVIMLITHNDSVLIGRSPGWPGGMYSLLAGFVEPGETLEAAVRREVQEETGVKVGEVGYLASQPWPFPSSLMIGCYGLAETREITIDPAEIEDALWITRADMLQVFAGENPDILPARQGAIAHFLLRNWLADCLD